MSDSVLDLIDNVIDQHGDAMRWSPDAPEPPRPSSIVVPFRFDAWLAGNDLHLEPWQLSLVNHVFTSPPDVTFTFHARGRRTLVFHGELAEMAAYCAEKGAELRQRIAERRRRLARMHSAYRRRNR